MQLELYLHDIQIELENLEWDRKELVDDLRTAIKERKRMELILAEVEEEHDKAIAKIEQLEGEVQMSYCSIMRNFIRWIECMLSENVIEQLRFKF